MNLQTDIINNVLIIKLLETRLDAKFAVDFRNQIADLSKENPNIIIDFSNINFIDSSGLGAIVSILKLIGRNGKLALTCINKIVIQTFLRTKMDKIFSIYISNDEALKNFI